MKRIFTLLFSLCLCAVMSAQGVKPLPSLHVEGKWIVDKHGNHVVLHGVMDTPNMYFNGWHWGSPWTGVNYDNNGVVKCREYFSKLFWAFEQAKCNLFRLHLDPAWTNDPDANYTYAGSVGQSSEASGEADISKFNPSRLTSFMKTLYFPLAKDAMNHGQFVIMRPPGVCPRDLKVGDYYQQYLVTVWDIVSKNDSVKKYAGQISLELANEPINIRNKNNQESVTAMRDYFQPVVNKIRENGFTGIILIPGTGYQSNYRNYKNYPITDPGNNFGYAVHDYPGWYNASDDNCNAATKTNSFRDAVPVVDTKPIVITEVDWSPLKEPLEFDHNNEWGQPVYKNLGTWATASTSKWGQAYKWMLDYFKNISMTLTHPHDFLDIDTLLQKNKVVAAFDANPEACGKACMDWYAEYYKVDWAHSDWEGTPEWYTAKNLTKTTAVSTMSLGGVIKPEFECAYVDGHKVNATDSVTLTSSNPKVVTVENGQLTACNEGIAEITATYTDPMGNTIETKFNVKTTIFSFQEPFFNKAIVGEGIYNERIHAFKPSAGGQMGWVYPSAIDLSGYRYLVCKLDRAQTCDAHVNIYTENDVNGDCFSSETMGSGKLFAIDLQQARYTSGSKVGELLNLANVNIISFWGNGNGMVVLEEIYLTNNDDYSPMTTAVRPAVKVQLPAADAVFSLSGQRVGRLGQQGLRPGIYVMGGKKIIIK